MRLKYVADEIRYYPWLGLWACRGEEFELDADPGDGRWQVVSDDDADSAEDQEK